MEILVIFIAFLPLVFSNSFEESLFMDEWKFHSALNMPFNDTSAGLQWYINTDYESHYNVRDVWKMNYTGAGVVVTVVDEGLDPTHAELKRNYDKDASYDFVDNDDYPKPKNSMDRVHMTGHGSKCAGVIAAEGNNGFCGVGLAYNARIGGIRLYVDDMAPDQREAKALMYNRQHIDIYSNSWGPSSKGFEVKGPGHQTQRALRDGAKEGRDKKGSIFVFAAGNGGILAKDGCAYNGYVNSIYTIAITGLNRAGSVPPYGERCPGIMAAAYSRKTFGEWNPVVTAGENGQCEYQFGGSSAATAMASGIIALTLEANPQLTWRDIQHIIARSARFPKIHKPRVNAAGLSVSNYIGFGLMDALKMVTFAKQWTKVPKQQKCEISRFIGNKSDEKKVSERDTVHISGSSKCGNIGFLEHVQVRVNLEVWPRGDLLLTLESPSKTISRLTQHRPIDRFWGHSNNLTDWTILTLHHWGEDPRGSWKLRAELGSGGRLFDWTLILYGTESDPLERNKHVMNAAAPVHSNNGPSLTGYVGYIVQVTSRYSVKISNNTRIKLFGVLGRTGEQELNSGEKAWSHGRSQYFYFRGDPVGNLTAIQFIDRNTGRHSQWHLYDVAVRQEGNNPWIVFRNNGWVYGKRITLKRECQKGYQRNSVGQCEDIDECSRNYCQQKCKNFPGGYKCSCYKGYHQHRWYAGRCTDINECSIRNGGCQQNCKNLPGSYKCSCDQGYHLRTYSKTCVDINECSFHKGGCQQNCKNLPGSYECSCDQGYHLRGDLKTCEAVSQEQSMPRTCKDILNLNPRQLDSSHDIYPQRQCNASVKVYCYGMATKNPTEYVTVKRYSNFVKDSRGETFFQKVRLDPSSMLIVSNDTKFAGDNKRQFGSTPSPCCFRRPTCSPSHIKIDLKQTGLRLDHQVRWKSTSRETEVRVTGYDEDGQYNIECHGCNGQCRPEGGLKVIINGC